jgi:hypothetical protein
MRTCVRHPVALHDGKHQRPDPLVLPLASFPALPSFPLTSSLPLSPLDFGDQPLPPQCDVLRPLRLPALLVGDPRLGGIAATLSAFDSLVSRGWDVEAVVLVGQHSAPKVGRGVERG